MLKGTVIWTCVLTIFSFTAASFKFNAKNFTSDSQIVLKSLAEAHQQDHLYNPLRIHINMIEESFSDEEQYENLQSILVTSAQIMSDLLIIKPSTEKLRLSEINQCTDILFGQMIQSEDLEADIVIFAVNSQEKGEIISKICEINENKTVKSMALKINTEKLMKLDELSQVKELCFAISRALYEDNEGERQVLLSEIGKVLAKEREIKTVQLLGACAAGSNNCATCDVTNSYCIACATDYILYYADGLCVACASPCSSACEWICSTCSITTTNCTSCNPGYWLSANGCTSCTPPCARCSSTSGTFCTACYDSMHSTLNTDTGTCSCIDPNASYNQYTGLCVCKNGYFGTPGACTACTPPCTSCQTGATACTSCETGYYLNGNVCTACTAPCSACSTSSTTCTACDDPTHSILWAGTCACADTNANYNGSNLCVCKTGYYGTAGSCTACPAGCPTCSSGTVCSACNAGYWLNGNTCTACIAPCSTCSTSSTACTACDDPTHSILNAGTCSCTDTNANYNEFNLCVCKTGYYGTTGSCTACPVSCSACTSGTVCTACNIGYYLNGNTCMACIAPCWSCSTSATTCTSCDDPTHSTLKAGTCSCTDTNANYSGSNLCVCKTGYFGTPGTCTACLVGCSACISGTACTACYIGYWLNGKNCQACIPPCSKCSTSSTVCTACVAGTTLNAGTCTCTDPNASFNGNYDACVCHPGYYSNAGVCTACTSPCATCFAGTSCLSCNYGYFLNGISCNACESPCGSCEVTATTCTSCVNIVILELNGNACECKDPNASFEVAENVCVCNPKYFELDGICTSCNPECATCDIVASNCESCAVGFFNQNNLCIACQSPCASCTYSATICDSCVDDSNSYISGGHCMCKDPNASYNGNVCTCNAGYYSIGGICTASCTAPCATCTTSTTFCTSCNDPKHSTLTTNTGKCTCTDPNAQFDTGYLTCQCKPGYFGMPNSCTACSSNCATCINSASNCQKCIDTVHMSPPACFCPSNTYLTNGECFCVKGYFYSSNTVCSPCRSECAECVHAYYYCTACKDPEHMTLNGNQCECRGDHINFNSDSGKCECTPDSSFSSSGLCECNPGYAEYYGICTACSNFNTTWNAITKTCVCNDTNASLDIFSGMCRCNPDYFDIEGVCTGCFAPCLTCWGVPNFCTSCYDATNMILSGGICKCTDSNYVFNQASRTCNSGSNCNQCCPPIWYYFSLTLTFILID